MTKNELISFTREYLNELGEPDDPVVKFESWESTLGKSFMVDDYSVKYNPYTELLNVQWIPSWENIEWAAEMRIQRLSEELRDLISSLSPEEFELLLKQVFSRVPWAKDVRVTGRSGDGGIDFTGKFIEKHSGVEFLLFGQAKHWSSKVGSDTIRTFLGSVTITARARAAVGIFVSTGGFTNDAREAAQGSPTKIVLMDSDQLAEAMLQNGIGISDASIRGKRIDNGFWHDIQG